MSAAPRFRALSDKRDTCYQPNYAFSGEVIDDSHRNAPALVADVEGWLLDEDALKLYELAYFTSGPVLEIGSFHGKSSIVMSRAIQNSGRGTFVVSLDVDASALEIARRNAARLNASPTVLYVHGTPDALHEAIGSLVPQLTFVDGLHTYEGVRRDLQAIEPLIPVGGILAFHDYIAEEDPDHRRPDWYQVFEAVGDSWVPAACEFAGTSGGCGVFRRLSGDMAPASAEASLLRLPATGLRAGASALGSRRR